MEIKEVADTDFEYVWLQREILVGGIRCDGCGVILTAGEIAWVMKDKRTNKTVTYRCKKCGGDMWGLGVTGGPGF